MNTEQYLLIRKKQQEGLPNHRKQCFHCRQPLVNCYCSLLQRFDSKISFVILIHPIEVKRRIATGRMSHLLLENSYLIEGEDYSENQLVNQLIEDPNYQRYILYPGKEAVNLSQMTDAERFSKFSTHLPLRIFLIDGTWAKAKTMLRKSQNLQKLKQMAFIPDRPSTFRVRKQPKSNFFSTIEAIHQSIELLGQSQGFATENRTHDRLLKTFDSMVERQLQFGGSN